MVDFIMLPRFVLLGWVWWALAGGLAAAGEDERLPVKIRVNLVLASLAYDGNLTTRCAAGLRIGIVGLTGDEASQAVVEETTATMASAASRKVNGLGIAVE